MANTPLEYELMMAAVQRVAELWHVRRVDADYAVAFVRNIVDSLSLKQQLETQEEQH